MLIVLLTWFTLTTELVSHDPYKFLIVTLNNVHDSCMLQLEHKTWKRTCVSVITLYACTYFTVDMLCLNK